MMRFRSEFHRWHAVKANEFSLAFMVLPHIGQYGILHLHPSLLLLVNFNPWVLEIFGTNPSFILYAYNILYLSCLLCMLNMRSLLMHWAQSLSFIPSIFLVKILCVSSSRSISLRLDGLGDHSGEQQSRCVLTSEFQIVIIGSASRVRKALSAQPDISLAFDTVFSNGLLSGF